MFGYLHSSHNFFLIVTVQRTQVISLNVSHSDGQKQSCMFWQKH